MPISPANSLFLCLWVEIGKLFIGKKDPLRRCDHGTKLFCAYFSFTSYFNTKNSVRLILKFCLQVRSVLIVMMNITFNLNVAARFFVVGNNQDNKKDIFQVLHRGLRSRLCQERSVRDQAVSPNLLARLDGQSWKNCDILSAGKEITTLHAVSASFSPSKKCQNQFGKGGGGPPSQFGQCPKARFFLSGKSSLKNNTNICPEIAY